MKRSILVLASIQLIGILCFCKGFFPYKRYLSGYATQQVVDEPTFDRLVFVLIDALRNDFILGQDSGFEFVNEQINKGTAYPFTAKASAPTVTMPRIKALTTGTIPNFLDAILNIAESDTTSALNHHDNWLHQFKNNGNKTIHFFGDDTWMRLFPDIFSKTDGTTSFFVSDTVEVDLNVTRHIKTDLMQEDWDAMILHYLGLDHVGHLGGPNSPLMKPKQKEMDTAIKEIYDIIKKQDQNNKTKTLLIVCGDHGMNDKGNHGGSSIEETSAALVFMSPKFELEPFKAKMPTIKRFVFGYPIIDQIDLVPTLAYLFAFPIPKNNLGKIILDFDNNYVKLLQGLELNMNQLLQLLPHQKYDQFQKENIASFYKIIEEVQSELVHAASEYNLKLMTIGLVLICTSAIISMVRLVDYSVIGVVIYSISMFSSSFIEQEHMIWYYLLQTTTFFNMKYSISGSIIQLMLTRCMMELNNFKLESIHMLGLTLLVNLIFCVRILNRLKTHETGKIIHNLTKLLFLTIVVLLSIFTMTYKIRNQKIQCYQFFLNWELIQSLNQVDLGRLIYNYQFAGLFVLYGLHYITKRGNMMYIEEIPAKDNKQIILELFLYLMTPLFLLLNGLDKSILFLIFNIEFQILKRYSSKMSNLQLNFYMLCIIQSSFYLTGHTNSISSIDLSHAYIGMEGYNSILIGLFTFLSNWSGPLWWLIVEWILVQDYLVVQSNFNSIIMVILTISVSTLREHLFIWTVFSPKYLFQLVWICLFHWLFRGLLGTIITQILLK